MNHIHVFSSFLACSPQALTFKHHLADSIWLNQQHPPRSRKASCASPPTCHDKMNMIFMYVPASYLTSVQAICAQDAKFWFGKGLCIFAVQSISSSAVVLLLSWLDSIAVKYQNCQSIGRQSACSPTCLCEPSWLIHCDQQAQPLSAHVHLCMHTCAYMCI